MHSQRPRRHERGTEITHQAHRCTQIEIVRWANQRNQMARRHIVQMARATLREAIVQTYRHQNRRHVIQFMIGRQRLSWKDNLACGILAIHAL
jgi:hypothetical protein